ncbi:MAG: co-chaperone GroES [candidate division WS1 bacterium]|jgi:chaperonin GroES|nr:co-chaperone GroES [candidate division WS1 bacterium]
MLQPLNDRVLVKPLDAEEKSAGGIILPQTAQERPREGKVVAVGPGRMLDSGDRQAMSVKVDDVIVYTEYGGTEVKVDGEEYLLVDEGSILAVKA